MSKKKKAAKATKQDKPTLVVLLLDRSGSMMSCKKDTIAGFNGYLEEVKGKKVTEDMRFSFTQFDSEGIDDLAVVQPVSRVPLLTELTYQPRGNTPLYDAMFKTIRKTQKQAGSKYKVMFVTLTDGQENSSIEWRLDDLQKLIKEKESRDHWTFAYIGVGIGGYAATSTVAAGTKGASNVMRSSHNKTRSAYRSLAGATACYSANVSASGQSVQNVWDDGHDESN